MREPQPKILHLRLSIDSVGCFKRYTCAKYEACMDLAAEKNWPQFHCRDCPAYQLVDQGMLDMSRLPEVQDDQAED